MLGSVTDANTAYDLDFEFRNSLSRVAFSGACWLLLVVVVVIAAMQGRAIVAGGLAIAAVAGLVIGAAE